MNCPGERWHPYSLQLTAGWQTQRGQLTTRAGRLLQLTDDCGHEGWGDSAPLPEFGITPARADAFARDTAALDLAARAAGQPLNAWLSGLAPVGELAVNAYLGRLIDWQPAMLAEATQAGYRLLKFKLGCAPLATELRTLADCCRALAPETMLRLDANGAWTVAAARQFVEACRHWPIDALEDPLQQPDCNALADLQARATFAIALDEAVDLLTPAFFAQPPVRRLVLKPARFGGLRSTWKIGQNAQTAGIECVVTGALESACGLLACAHLAAALAPFAVHGLATGNWLTGSPWPWPRIHNGRLQLPAQPGLGFTPR